jgi:hypothetical protein
MNAVYTYIRNLVKSLYRAKVRFSPVFRLCYAFTILHQIHTCTLIITSTFEKLDQQVLRLTNHTYLASYRKIM